MKVRNDGVHTVKINKGDEIGVVQIETELGQKIPVTEAEDRVMDNKSSHQEEEEIKLIPKIQENKGIKSNSVSSFKEETQKQVDSHYHHKREHFIPFQQSIIAKTEGVQEGRSISDELLDHYKQLHGDAVSTSSIMSQEDERNLQFQKLREKFNKVRNKQTHHNWTSDDLDN